MWIVYALVSAVFAAATSILAKIGIEDVNSNVATAVRTAMVLIMAWGLVFITGRQHEVLDITRKSWLFLVLSGCATGLSWLFYYRALQTGPVSKVVPIDKLSVVISMAMAFLILGEKVGVKSIIGGLLIAAGTLVLAL
ncbi:membrane protein [Clostridia bacterium]|nr:membrane protein [Clostridia bacterium]